MYIEDGKENEEGENAEEKKKEEDKPPVLVVEVYDPSTPSFQFVKEIFLYKNEEQTPFMKNKNSIEFIKESSFATNGQVLLIQTNDTQFFFDLKSGIRIAKTKITEEEQKDCRISYDFNNNAFYSFKYANANTRLEVFTITNFKKAGVSFGFAKEFLGKRLHAFRATIYGDNPIVESKLAPSKLNLIQRIMKNVTTPVLIEHSRIVSDLPYSGPLLAKLLRTLILRFIEK